MKLLLALFLAFTAATMAEQPMVSIRMSFKAIRKPTTGVIHHLATKEFMLAVVSEMNLAMDRCKRGLRFVYDDFDALGQMIQIGDPNNNTTSPTNPSYWWDVDPGLMDGFGIQANANPAAFAYRSTHVNIYLAAATYGAAGASFPNDGGLPPAQNNLVVSGVGGDSLTSAPRYANTMLHEMGHYFSLLHTFNDAVGIAVSGSTFGDDGMTDTLLDTAWDAFGYGGAARGLNYFADVAFNLSYNALNATQQTQVLGQWRNFYALRLFGVTTYGGLSAAQKAHLDANQATTHDSDSLMVRDLIAAANYNGPNNPQRIFNNPALPHLTADEQQKVENVINNHMSYYAQDESLAGYSEQQLDTIADTITSGGRLPVATGRTFFLGAGPRTEIAAPLGSSRWPYLSPAVVAASTPSPAWSINDQVLVRPGAYAGPVTFNKPMTLRVSTTTNPANHNLRTDQHATFGSSINH